MLDHNSADEIVSEITKRYPYLHVEKLGPCQISAGIQNDRMFSMTIQYGYYGVGTNWAIDDDRSWVTREINPLINGIGIILDGWALKLAFRQAKILESLRSIERIT